MKLSKLLTESYDEPTLRELITSVKEIDKGLAKEIAGYFQSSTMVNPLDIQSLITLIDKIRRLSYNKGTYDASSPGVAHNGW